MDDVSEWTLEQVDEYISDRLAGGKVCTDLHMFAVLTRLREMLEEVEGTLVTVESERQDLEDELESEFYWALHD